MQNVFSCTGPESLAVERRELMTESRSDAAMKSPVLPTVSPELVAGKLGELPPCVVQGKLARDFFGRPQTDFLHLGPVGAQPFGGLKLRKIDEDQFLFERSLPTE